MDVAYQGSPFVQVPAKSVILTATMDIAYLGAPFVVNDYSGTPPSGWAHTFLTVAGANIASALGVPIANISKIMGT